ncbi:GntR family transcriptional regulator, partial [Cryobacterium sp. RTS3]
MKQARAKSIQLSLDRASPIGLVDQIATNLAQLIAQGMLRSGEQLPSVRQFGIDQGIGTSTVVEAYERLVARGLV